MFDASQRPNSTGHDDTTVSSDRHPAQVEGLKDAADESTAALAPRQDDDVLALDAALNATLADLAEASTLNVDPELETTVLFRYGALLTGPAVLDHVRRHLRVAEVRGEQERVRQLQAVRRSIEGLQAMDAGALSVFIDGTMTFRATVEALHAYLGASSMEAAYEVLKRQHELLTTELAVDLIDGKVGELRGSGQVEAARNLQRGPLRLVHDVRQHGLQQGYEAFLDREWRQEAAQVRLGLITAAVDPEVLRAVDTVLGAADAAALARALAHGYRWLVQPEAAMMVREGAAIVAAAGTSDTEAAHVASLANTLERLSAIAVEEPQLSREEQVQWALAK
jgi:hypothetical protein